MEFREKLEVQIEEYGREIKSLLVEQTGDDADVEKRITLFKTRRLFAPGHTRQVFA